MLHAVIMAGGAGTRFWPRSRRARPKQLIQIGGQKSMLATAFERLQSNVPQENIWVVTTADLRGAIQEEIPALPQDRILAEPMGRDTAAAIGLAAAVIHARDPDAVMIVTPSDHAIAPMAKFQQAVRAAAAFVTQENYLLTFAVVPSYPSTGYGYIEKGKDVDNGGDLMVFHAKAFTEKPDLATAKVYLKHGKYFWNAGIFVWRARQILEEIRKYLPDHAKGLARIAETWGTPGGWEVLKTVYAGFRKVSIDYGIMEPAARDGRVVMVPASFHWDDVGSWASLANHLPADADGNVAEGTVVAIDSHNNIISSEGSHLVATLGVSGLVIVHTPDATLVTTREKAQEIKKVVTRLEEKKLDQYL